MNEPRLCRCGKSCPPPARPNRAGPQWCSAACYRHYWNIERKVCPDAAELRRHKTALEMKRRKEIPDVYRKYRLKYRHGTAGKAAIKRFLKKHRVRYNKKANNGKRRRRAARLEVEMLLKLAAVQVQITE